MAGPASTTQIQPNLLTYSTGFTRGALGNLPLTTIFTPPPSCLSTVTYDGTSFWQGGILQTGDQNCFPDHFTDIFYSHYSPGICPSGWTSVDNPNGIGPITQLDGTEASRAYCCPSGFYHLSTNTPFSNNHLCASLFGSPLRRVYSTSTLAGGPIPRNADLITIDPATIERNTVFADIIQIQWAPTDSNIISLLSAQTATSSASRVRATPAHRTIAAVRPTRGSSSDYNNIGPPSYSAGAIAGMTIGITVFVLTFLLLLYFLWRRRRLRTRSLPHHHRYNQDHKNHWQSIHELDSNAEKSCTKPIEMPTTEVAHEMPTAQELPTCELESPMDEKIGGGGGVGGWGRGRDGGDGGWGRGSVWTMGTMGAGTTITTTMTESPMSEGRGSQKRPWGVV